MRTGNSMRSTATTPDKVGSRRLGRAVGAGIEVEVFSSLVHVTPAAGAVLPAWGSPGQHVLHDGQRSGHAILELADHGVSDVGVDNLRRETRAARAAIEPVGNVRSACDAYPPWQGLSWGVPTRSRCGTGSPPGPTTGAPGAG